MLFIFVHIISNFKTRISKYDFEDDLWSDRLLDIAFSINIEKQCTTKYTPYYLLFGRDPKIPQDIKLMTSSEINISDEIDEKEVANRINIKEEVKKKVLENISLEQKKQKKRYDNNMKDKVKCFNHRVADTVMRKNFKSIKMGNKMMPKWIGPYVITNIDTFNRITIKEKTTSKILKKKFPYEHIKPYKSNQYNVFAKELIIKYTLSDHNYAQQNILNQKEKNPVLENDESIVTKDMVDNCKALQGVYKSSLNTLVENEWLDDEIIRNYFQIIANNDNSLNKYFIFDSNLGNLFDKQIFSYDKIDLTCFNRFFLPIIINSNHWILLYANIDAKSIYAIDSLNYKAMSIKKAKEFRDFLSSMFKAINEWDILYQNFYIQSDSYNCGVFVCMAAARIIKGSDMITCPTKMRRHIFNKLIQF